MPVMAEKGYSPVMSPPVALQDDVTDEAVSPTTALAYVLKAPPEEPPIIDSTDLVMQKTTSPMMVAELIAESLEKESTTSERDVSPIVFPAPVRELVNGEPVSG